MPPTLEDRSYRSMYAFGNHIHVVSAKEHLTTHDNGVIATFEQACVLGSNDQRLVIAKLEYIGWVEEILELTIVVVVQLPNEINTNLPSYTLLL